MRHPAHRSFDFSSAWYLVLALPCAIILGVVLVAGLRQLEQPDAAVPAETVSLPPVA